MSYVKKTWAGGDTITSAALNNMENGIEAAAAASLPEVSAADNGKAAKVANGAWSAVDDKLVVTMTESSGTYTADKTVEEILAADAAGKTVEAVMPTNDRLKLTIVNPTKKIVQFTGPYRDMVTLKNMVCYLYGAHSDMMGFDTWSLWQTNIDSNEFHVPITLTADEQTGEISGTTSAMFAFGLMAANGGKTIICDAEQALSGNGKIYYRGIMRAVSDGENSYIACSIPKRNGTKLDVLTITWTSSGVDVDVGQITFDV